MFACGYSGVRVAAFFEKLAHFLEFVFKVGVITAEASQPEKLREWDGIFHVLWMIGRMQQVVMRINWLVVYASG